jgi:ABC-type polysaccharide/polyol phosphate transport system ATPase subunit
MSEVILSIDNICKKYCRDLHLSLHYGTVDLWNGLSRASKCPREGLRSGEFWALKDVRAELPKGESLGVLGRNGSGKSTLLKILNGTLKPTSGEATIYGSVRLLALGSGFNPILSGAENIRINCALLGYNARDTEDIYNEIADFSELGEFIDAPVKTYSSGMYARLGFAAAVVSNPDLLLIDEALAVGDLPFVSKCLRRIHRYRSAGGSVVLVSHSGYTVRLNCTKALWLKDGHVQMYGDANEVCTEYEIYLAKSTASQDPESVAQLRQVSELITRAQLHCPERAESGTAFLVTVVLESSSDMPQGGISLTFVDYNNTNVFFSLPSRRGLQNGLNTWTFHYPNLNLMRGIYRINLVVFDDNYENQHATIYNAAEFEVTMPTNQITGGIVTMPMHLETNP